MHRERTLRALLAMLAMWAALAPGLGLAGGELTVSGSVSDDSTESSIAGVEVRLYEFDDVAGAWVPLASAVTDSEGQYSIDQTLAGDPLPNGQYKVATSNDLGFIDEIYVEDFPIGQKGFSNFSCADIQCEFALATAGTVFDTAETGSLSLFFGLVPGDQVSGTVAASGGTPPAAGVELCLFEADSDEARYCAFSDGSGTYATPAFDADALGGFHVAVVETRPAGPGAQACDGSAAASFESYLVPEVADGESGYFTYLGGGSAPNLSGAGTFSGGQSLDFELDEGAVFCGSVVDEDAPGTPLENITVQLFDELGNLVYQTAPGDLVGPGAFETPALPLQSYLAIGISAQDSPGYVRDVFDGGKGLFCQPSSCLAKALEAGEPLTPGAGSETVVDFFLEQGEFVSGVVLGEETQGQQPQFKGEPFGLPLDNVEVCAFASNGDPLDACAFTTMGDYQLFLPKASIRLAADPSDVFGRGAAYLPQVFDGVTAVPVDILAGDLIDLTDGAQTADFLLEPGAIVTGDVFDEMSFGTIESYEVKIFDAAGRFVTSALPELRFPARKGTRSGGKGEVSAPYEAVVPPGDYRFVVEATGEPDENGAGYLSEVLESFDGESSSSIYCVELGSCDPLAGGIVAIELGITLIDFDLTLGGTLAGRVFDQATNAAISGASVAVYAGPTRFATLPTDSAGRYEALLPPGSYALQSVAGGYFNEIYLDRRCPTPDCSGAFPPGGLVPTAVNVSTTAPAAGRDFALAPEQYAIGGTVTAADSGLPLAGAEVCLFDATGAQLSCDTTFISGNFEFEVFEAGDYYLTATAPEFSSAAFPGIACGAPCDPLLGDAITVGPDELDADIALAPITSYAIAGAVSENPAPAEGGAIEGAEICAYDALGEVVACAASDATGAYRVEGLTAGTYFAAVTASGFEPQVHAGIACPDSVCPITEGTPITLGPDATGIDFALSLAPVTISGRVAGLVPAKGLVPPVAGAEVCFFDPAGEPVGDCAVTGADGTFVSDPLPPISYYIRITAAGFLGQLYDQIPCEPGCDVTAGTLLDARGGATLDFVLDPAGTISGEVTLLVTGSGLRNVPVVAVDDSGMPQSMAMTDERGTYLIPSLPPGTYFVYADGEEPGFFSKIYVGPEASGVPCPTERCSEDAPKLGAAVIVSAQEDTPGVDFALDAGSELSTETAKELDEEGASVAICGARLAIGVPGDDTAGPDAGAVLIYHRRGSGYVFVEKLLPQPEPGGGGVAGLRYGSAIDCTDDTLVIGAPADAPAAKGTGGGTASGFILQITGNGNYQQLQQLIAENLGMGTGSGFGQAVSMAGSTIAVGAPNVDGKGAVSVISNTGSVEFPWQQSFMLNDPDANDGADFGAAVDVGEGGVIGVGAPNQTAPGTPLTAGVAQIFSNLAGTDDWTSIGKITNPNGPQPGDAFGASVSVSGGTLAVGAPGDDTEAGSNSGSAALYQFDGGNIVQVANLVPSDASGGEAFGSSVSLSGNQLAIGAQQGSGVVNGSGAAYLFGVVNLSWQETGKVLPQVGGAGDLFGASIALKDGTLVVGAPNSAPTGTIRTGKAEAFTDADQLFGGGFEE